MIDMVCDIFDSNFRKEIDEGVERLGVRTLDLLLEEGSGLNLRLVLIPKVKSNEDEE